MDKAKPPRKSTPQQAQGRVDITDELVRYVLCRFEDEGCDVWMIEGLQPRLHLDERGGLANEHGVLVPASQVFSREALEIVLTNYLR